jgi:hypothetical protein
MDFVCFCGSEGITEIDSDPKTELEATFHSQAKGFQAKSSPAFCPCGRMQARNGFQLAGRDGGRGQKQKPSPSEKPSSL